MSAPADTPTPAHDRDEMWVCRLGTVPYQRGVEIQEQLRRRRQADEIPDTLLLLEHPPVYTRGRRAQDGELSLGEAFYRERGIEIVATNRGGRVTYHGPGQLVGYPIMHVEDVIGHLRDMESAIVAALDEEGVQARSRCDEGPDWTGVWVGPRKIASLGVHVSRGVSAHGFAVNVTNDLTPFSWVVPCGLTGVSMTSLAAEVGGAAVAGSPSEVDGSAARGGAAASGSAEAASETVDFERFAGRVVARFCEVHRRVAKEVTPAELGIPAAIAVPSEIGAPLDGEVPAQPRTGAPTQPARMAA